MITYLGKTKKFMKRMKKIGPKWVVLLTNILPYIESSATFSKLILNKETKNWIRDTGFQYCHNIHFHISKRVNIEVEEEKKMELNFVRRLTIRTVKFSFDWIDPFPNLVEMNISSMSFMFFTSVDKRRRRSFEKIKKLSCWKSTGIKNENFFALFPSLERLELQAFMFTDESFLPKNLSTLKVLVLGSGCECSFESENVRVEKNILENLEELEIQSRSNNELCKIIFDNNDLKKLERLNFMNIDSVGNEEIKRLTKLKNIRLNYSGVSDDLFLSLPELKSVELNFCLNIERILNVLSKLEELNLLLLYDINSFVDVVSEEEEKSGIKRLEKLEHLEIRLVKKFSDETFLRLNEKVLRKLVISFNTLVSEKGILNFKNLEHLELTKCQNVKSLDFRSLPLKTFVIEKDSTNEELLLNPHSICVIEILHCERLRMGNFNEFQSLRSFSIVDNDLLGDEVLTSVSKTLVKLSIEISPNFSDESIAKLSNITYLSLRGTKGLSDKSIISIRDTLEEIVVFLCPLVTIESIKELTKLTDLTLDEDYHQKEEEYFDSIKNKVNLTIEDVFVD